MALPPELAVADLVWSIEGKEIAVNRIWLQHEHQATVNFTWGDALQTIADKVVSSLDTGGSGHGVLTYVSSGVWLSRVDAYQIGTDGKATDKRSHALTQNAVQGNSGGDYVPSLGAVIQLWGYDPATFTQHPRQHRGRLYAPGTPFGLFTDTGELAASFADSMAGAWADFMNDLQGMHVGDTAGPGPTDNMNVGVLSRTAQQFYQLRAVTVALKPGYQRRRMNKLAAGRSATHAVTTS